MGSPTFLPRRRSGKGRRGQFRGMWPRDPKFTGRATILGQKNIPPFWQQHTRRVSSKTSFSFLQSQGGFLGNLHVNHIYEKINSKVQICDFNFWLICHVVAIKPLYLKKLTLRISHRPYIRARWLASLTEVEVLLGADATRTLLVRSFRLVMHDLYLLWHSELPPCSQLHLIYFCTTCFLSLLTQMMPITLVHGVTTGNGGHLSGCFKE